jgi:hypothetical protein
VARAARQLQAPEVQLLLEPEHVDVALGVVRVSVPRRSFSLRFS